jgi:diacylglycerol kinase family enzyme
MARETPRPAPSLPVVVVNPAAAGGTVRRRWAELEAAIRRALGDFTPAFTERAGHATELTRDALRAGAPLVIAMGGDGTINEVVNGFFPAHSMEANAHLVEANAHSTGANAHSTGASAHSTGASAHSTGASAHSTGANNGGDAPITPDAALAVIPMGTGGDFIKTTGTSRDIETAARAIAAAPPRPIDVGRLDFIANDGRPARRYFINITSIGIGGLVDRYVNQSSKILGGKATFYLATVRASLTYKNPRCRVTVDDGPARERPFYSIAVANGRYFGGGMMIAPDAALDDGLFDLVSIGDVGFMTMARHSRTVYEGRHVDLPFVSVERARKVVVAPLDDRPEVLLDVDGEQPGRLPATFTLLPRALLLRA